MLKRISKKILNNLGYQISRKDINSKDTKKAEGFPHYLQEAQELGVDINDYLNKKWMDPVMILEKTVFPYLMPIPNPIVCDVGAGSGRFSREVARKLKDSNWTLYVVDHSQWLVNFLSQYFENYQKIKPLLNDGKTLPFSENNFMDIIYSNNTFVELNLGMFYIYCEEFYRVLKPNGYLIFDYLDINTSEAWNHMLEQAKTLGYCFTYHTSGAVDKIFLQKGFELIERIQIGKSTYVIYKKSH